MKIPTLFERDPGDPSRVTTVANPLCTWVLADPKNPHGIGTASRMWDGVPVLVRDKKLYARQGGDWVEVTSEPEYQWFRAAVVRSGNPRVDAEYELCGPTIKGNPEGLSTHVLVLHGEEEHVVLDRSYEGIRAYLEANPMEGLVFRHLDLRMAKIKRSDFGLPWPVKP